MCGIAGYFGKSNLNQKDLNTLLKKMKSRGPNDQSYLKTFFSKKKVFFFSSRLSIVDRYPRSNQPMEIDNHIITFNGEIYNFEKLKKLLKKNKIKLKTKSDTEVVLRMYQLFGEKSVEYFDGMWAFAILEKKKKKIFLSRDRIGEKPLFYLKYKNQFFFGSQTSYIRQLAANYNKLNKNKIFSFLKFGYKSLCLDNETFFKKIYLLKPGQNLIINENLNTKFDYYWKPTIKEDQNLDERKSIKLIKNNFNKYIKKICKLDLKVGLSLSGGIDSSYLLGFFKKNIKGKIKTYSIIDSDKRYNEEAMINENLKKYKVSNTKIKLDIKNNYFKKLVQLIKYHDKPISTINYFLQSLIYEKMKKDKIKVCINGNGVDELFAGYYHYYQLYYNSLKSPKAKLKFYKLWSKKVLPFLRNPKLKELSNKKTLNTSSFFKNKELKFKNKLNFSEFFFCKNKLKNKMANELFHQTVPIALLEDDHNSMASSVESRSPFLNHRLVETSFKIPVKYLMKNSENKYLIRKSSKDYIPNKVRLNIEKKGFNASFHSIFNLNQKKFKNWLLDIKSPIYKFINYNHVKILINKSKTKKLDFDEQKLFNIVSIKIFLENI